MERKREWKHKEKVTLMWDTKIKKKEEFKTDASHCKNKNAQLSCEVQE